MDDENIIEDKAALRLKLATHVAEFLKRGGKIHVAGSAVYKRELKLSRIERIELMKAKVDRKHFGGHGMGMGK